MKTVIYNGKIVRKDGITENGYVVFENGKVCETGKDFDVQGFEGEKIDAQGKYLSAGFIDIHCHGGGGSDFMDGTEEAFRTILETHAKFGTTGMLATTTTATNEELARLFDTFNEFKNTEYNGAKLLGVHLEGPFISKDQAGAQDPIYIKNPVREDYEWIYNASKGCIKRWTVAPELPGSNEFIEYLVKNSVIPSIGHTSANYEQTKAAFDCGANLLTHFYSSMSTITRKSGFRVLGVIESGYIIDDMNVEIIADGCHLPAELIQLIVKSKGTDRICLITDAIRAAGQGVTESVIGSLENGMPIIIEDGVAKLPDRTSLAGSVCTANRLLRTMTKLAKVSLCDAVKMLTERPALTLGLENSKGKLEKGYDADIVMFDEDINVCLTVCEGRVIYKA